VGLQPDITLNSSLYTQGHWGKLAKNIGASRTGSGQPAITIGIMCSSGICIVSNF